MAGDTVTRYVTITKDVAGTYYADDFDKSNLVVTNADCYNISYEMSVTFIEVTFAIDFADVTLTYDGKPHGVLVKRPTKAKLRDNVRHDRKRLHTYFFARIYKRRRVRVQDIL